MLNKYHLLLNFIVDYDVIWGKKKNPKSEVLSLKHLGGRSAVDSQKH